MFCKYIDGDGIMVVIAYVDDLLFLGTPGMHSEIVALRKRVEMEDPQTLSKYLGCNHRCSSTKLGRDTVTRSVLDMSDYFKRACELYISKTGLSLKPVDSLYAPDLPQAQLDKLMEDPSKFGGDAASLLMKLIYGARMACPWLSVAIQQLARQVHRWTAECDRRLHRLYCYVSCTTDMTLSGSWLTADLDNLTLDTYVDSDIAGDVF